MRKRQDTFAEDRPASPAEQIKVPVVREEIKAEKRRVETGKVVVRKTVRRRREVVDLPLLEERVRVERVPVNRPVEGPVDIRREGNALVVPVLEEVLVVEKRLKLIEEVRLTKRRSTRHTQQRLTVRRQEAVIDRLAPPPEDEAGPTIMALGPSRRD